jgi:hypothetical protein
VRAISRRAALRGAALAIAVAPAGVGLLLATPESQAAENTERVDEIYKGRHIVGVGLSPAGVQPTLQIDGVELHIMANANGTYTTALNHYQGFHSVRDAAYAAVDELNGAELLPMTHLHR